MTRGAKMFMLANNRNRSDGNREGRMNYEMQNGYGNMEMNRMEMRDNPEMRGYDRDRRGRFTGEMEMHRTYEYEPRNTVTREMSGDYNAESRFRDNRGREHYDNGRYAPMRNEMRMGYDEPWSGGERTYDIDINRYEYEPQSRGGMEMNRENANMRGGGEVRMIGFDRPENEMRMGGADASIPQYREMDQMQGKAPQMGKGESKSMPEFSPAMAEQWTSHMKNTDGSKGPHWSMEQARQIIAQKKLKCDAYTFWAVLNAMYSDYGKTIQKHGVHTQDFYVDLATDWLKDEDAVDDKAAAYFTYVVKH